MNKRKDRPSNSSIIPIDLSSIPPAEIAKPGAATAAAAERVIVLSLLQKKIDSMEETIHEMHKSLHSLQNSMKSRAVSDSLSSYVIAMTEFAKKEDLLQIVSPSFQTILQNFLNSFNPGTSYYYFQPNETKIIYNYKKKVFYQKLSNISLEVLNLFDQLYGSELIVQYLHYFEQFPIQQTDEGTIDERLQNQVKFFWEKDV